MKTTMNITVNPELKKAFSEFAKSIETTPTNLLNMLMKNVITTRKVTFIDNDIFLNSIDYEDLPKNVKNSYDNIKLKKLEELDLVNI